MDKTISDRATAPQRIAAYMALADVLSFLGWMSARVYFAIIGDSEGDRKFVLNPTVLGLLPIVVLIWIVSFAVVGNSVFESKRMTRYGIAAVLMLAVPALPVAYFVITSFWRFAFSP